MYFNDVFIFSQYPRFNKNVEAKAFGHHGKYYILRPETIESYFVLWRLTHDQKYRDWAWDVVQSIEKYCRTPNGFSGIDDVYSKTPSKNDVQESFFIAEVLKVGCIFFLEYFENTIPFSCYIFYSICI